MPFMRWLGLSSILLTGLIVGCSSQDKGKNEGLDIPKPPEAEQSD